MPRQAVNRRGAWREPDSIPLHSRLRSGLLVGAAVYPGVAEHPADGPHSVVQTFYARLDLIPVGAGIGVGPAPAQVQVERRHLEHARGAAQIADMAKDVLDGQRSVGLALALAHLLADAYDRFDVGTARGQLVTEGVQASELHPNNRGWRGRGYRPLTSPAVVRRGSRGCARQGSSGCHRDGGRAGHVDERLDVAVQSLALDLAPDVAARLDLSLKCLDRPLPAFQPPAQLLVGRMGVQK